MQRKALEILANVVLLAIALLDEAEGVTPCHVRCAFALSHLWKSAQYV